MNFILRAPLTNLEQVELVTETPSGGRFDVASEPGLDAMVAQDSILHFYRTHRKTKAVLSRGTVQIWEYLKEYLNRIKLNWEPEEFDRAYALTKIAIRGAKYDESSVCIGVCQGSIFMHIFSSSPDSDYNIHLFCQVVPVSNNSLRVLRLIEQKLPTREREDMGGIGGHGMYTITFSARKTYFYSVESFIFSGNNQYLYYFKPGKSHTPGKLKLPGEFRALSSGWRMHPLLSGGRGRKTRLLAHKTVSRAVNFGAESPQSSAERAEPAMWFDEEEESCALVSFHSHSEAKSQILQLVVLEFS